MKKEEIDKLITESLSRDEAEFYNMLDEQNIFAMWDSVYAGKNKWIAIIMSIFIVLFVAAAIYSGYIFFTAELSSVEMIRYGAEMFIFMMFTAFLKLWLWNQMDKQSILRELKRVEFQIALLMEKLPQDNSG